MNITKEYLDKIDPRGECRKAWKENCEKFRDEQIFKRLISIKEYYEHNEEGHLSR